VGLGTTRRLGFPFAARRTPGNLLCSLSVSNLDMKLCPWTLKPFTLTSLLTVLLR